MTIAEKFSKLGIDNAPGQESLQKSAALEIRGEKLPGAAVDFSHGDVDAHEPVPGSLEIFAKGFAQGGSQAYTPYRGKKAYWNMLHPAYQPLQGFRLTRTRI
ncbi:hypothetical protein NE556_07395 [[Clostridium] symbiosum]|uniref:hypothetical protein n=1 Tax=Clostridium symbiosum TaxID=1512 RepID=UPI0021088DF2|nr:hypothetical protein [[Clostridium] symbiosum]MCQ4835032.1 hypothetical protein [[Clostridium] symbiosum]